MLFIFLSHLLVVIGYEDCHGTKVVVTYLVFWVTVCTSVVIISC